MSQESTPSHKKALVLFLYRRSYILKEIFE